ncbi:kinase-like domain-containing protein [Russula emetica]|nr:kinase-like domain-containing protein [Russula emetica]
MSEYRRKQTSSSTSPMVFRGTAPATLRKSSTLKKSSVFPGFSTHHRFDSKMDELFGRANISLSEGTVEEEFGRYVNSLASPRETDILHIWEVSSVPCEHVFSSAKVTDTLKRNQIHLMLMEALQTLKFSLKKDRQLISFTDRWKTAKAEMMEAQKFTNEDLLAQLLTGDRQTTTDALLNVFDDEQVELDDTWDGEVGSDVASSGWFYSYWSYTIRFMYHSLHSLKHSCSFLHPQPHLFSGSASRFLFPLLFGAMLGPSQVAYSRNTTLDIVWVRGRYRVGKPLGSGSFGSVYLGKDIKTEQDVALKLKVAQDSSSNLAHEYSVYQAISGLSRIPKVYWYGREGLYHVIVLDCLGSTLEEIGQTCIDTNAVFTYATQMLSILESLHDQHYIHLNVKPDNFALGIAPLALFVIHRSTVILD